MVSVMQRGPKRLRLGLRDRLVHRPGNAGNLGASSAFLWTSRGGTTARRIAGTIRANEATRSSSIGSFDGLARTRAFSGTSIY